MISKIKALFGAVLALALSTTSALAAITVHTENCTLPDGYTGQEWDVYYYYESGDTQNAFDVGDGEEFTVTVNSGLPSWVDHMDSLYNFWAHPAEEAGVYEISIKVTNTTTSEEQDIVLSATIHVTPPEVVDGKTSLPPLTKGLSSSVTLDGSVQYGTTPYTFTKTSGNLPAGVTLNSNGSLDGTPTEAGKFTFNVTITDSTIPSYSLENVEYTITVRDTVLTEYLDSNGAQQPANCVELTTDMTDLTPGWYVANGTLNYADKTSITVSGNVNLILADGSSMTVTRGANSKAGIVVSEGSSLNIYVQRAETGSLTVTGGSNSAGIGGSRFENAGAVTINGGNVKVTGGSNSAGIGGGRGGTGGAVTINGGNVTATGGSNGAGIGGGQSGAGGTVTINGGEITAKGGNYGAGIGGGQTGAGGTVTINGGNVTATGGALTTTSGIGSGIGAGSSGLSHGTLEVGSNMEVKAYSGSNPPQELTPDSEGHVTLGGERYYVVEPAPAVKEYTITYKSGSETLALEPAKYVKGEGLASLPEPETAPIGCVFAAWYDNAGLTGDPVTSIPTTATGDTTFYAKWEPYSQSVSYEDFDGETQRETCTALTESTTELTAGWYFVPETMTINGTVTVSGDVKLVLKDGVTLTVQAQAESGQSAITIAENKTLTVYGQSNGFGKLIATAGSTGVSGISGTLKIPASLSALGGVASPTHSLDRDVETGVVTLTYYGNAQKCIAVEPAVPDLITYMDGETRMEDLEPATYFKGRGATLPTAEEVKKPNYTFAGWYTVSDPLPGFDFPVTAIANTESGDKTFYAQWKKVAAPKIPITFVGADGKPAEEECTILTSDISTLNDGWYAVNGEVDYGDGSIKVDGDVHLVLVDYAKLTVTNVSSSVAAIEVTSGNSLSIYAQSRGNGVIEVKGGSDSAGIGGGSNASCGAVSIYGGKVTAIGSTVGAGIGGGWEGNGGKITIKGGGVTAYSKGAGAGIGGGYEAESQGSLTVAAGIGVCSKAVAETYADVPVNDETYAVTLDGKKNYVVAPISGIVYMDGESAIGGLEPDSYVEGVGATLAASATRVTPGYAFAGWYEKYGSSPVTAVPASATGTQTFYAHWTPIEYTVTYKKGASTLVDYSPKTYTVESSEIQRKLPSTAPADLGKEFVGWCSDADLTSDLVSSIPVDSTGNLTYYAKYRNITSDPISVDFVAADGTPMNETCQVLVRGMRYLDAAWYVVTNDLFLSDPLTIEGNVNLVLVDGVELTVVSTVDSKSAVTVASGCSLTIWGQTEGTGELDAWASSSYSDGCGIEGKYGGSGVNITINGGTVTATGNQGAAGIGNCINASGITVTINGGTVTATGGSKGAGIGGGSARSGATVIINGGTVTASGGIGDDDFFGSGIGGGAIASNHGTLTVGSGMEVKAGATMNPTTELTPDSEGRVTLSGERFYVIKAASPEPESGYSAWAKANGISGGMEETDANGIANVFRYVFNVPSGAFSQPMINITISDGKAIVTTPEVVKTDGVTLSIVGSSDVQGKMDVVSYTLSEAAAGITLSGGARFFRLNADVTE